MEVLPKYLNWASFLIIVKLKLYTDLILEDDSEYTP